MISRAQRLEPLACEAPRVVSFASVPDVLASGGTANLFWTVSGADSVSLGADGGPFPPSGSVALALASGKTFTLTATGPCGTATAQLAVPVGGTPAPGLSAPSGSPGQLLTIRPVGVEATR